MFKNTMWNGDDYKKNITCKVGLKHVFANIGNSLRTSQVCHPELGSGVFWNDSQLELAWADQEIVGAHNSRPLLGSWDGRIGRHMPDTPKIGNVCVMLSLALQLCDVWCLKSSACTTNNQLEFQFAPAPLRAAERHAG